MTRVGVVFLRGVNVGGRKVTNADLTACLGQVSEITAVKPVLASGNAVVATTLSPGDLATSCERALHAHFGFDVSVVALSRDEVARLAAENPFPIDDPDMHAYLTVATDSAALDAWERVAGELGQPYARLSPVAFAWPCPAGQTLTAPFARAQAVSPLRQVQGQVTTRNARTLVKILAVTLT
jgi:uncharacterized protein (DUF1697 family)